ncbi:MAG: aromatic ring-hydroxylating dioxygenase subunit alpha [Bacteroidota bacterium]
MYEIDPSIRKATTLPSDFYQNPATWEAVRERVFARSWLCLGDRDLMLRGPENVVPRWLLENYLDEPVLLVRDKEALHCLTNVCTHRGFLLAQHPTRARKLVCQYHGRKFALDGTFESMPEFREAEDFPRPCDHLHRLPLENWRQFLFTGVDPRHDFSTIRDRLDDKLGFLPIEDFVYRPELSKTYNISAHWALYCDNYLEGFHIPFVHATLGSLLDYGQYSTDCFDGIVLQTGYAGDNDFIFDLPEGQPDFGKRVTAYYYWIFPNMMLNFYPWGLQTNIVRPVNSNFTKVEFEYYIYDAEMFELMNGAQVAEKTEREDEFVVEAVHRGLRSRFYKSGRFSPKREKGVHYFHQLLAQALSEG